MDLDLKILKKTIESYNKEKKIESLTFWILSKKYNTKGLYYLSEILTFEQLNKLIDRYPNSYIYIPPKSDILILMYCIFVFFYEQQGYSRKEALAKARNFLPEEYKDLLEVINKNDLNKKINFVKKEYGDLITTIIKNVIKDIV